MSTSTQHPLAADYMKRLERASRDLPRDRRADLLAEIQAHLAETIPHDASTATALTALDRLGDPEAIAVAELPDRATAARRGTREWAAIFLLLFGGFLLAFGWLVGVVLLWSSSRWSTRDKWIGTLILPGGLATAFTLALLTSGGSISCSGHQQAPPLGSERALHIPTVVCQSVSSGTNVPLVILFVVLALSPFATAIHLARRVA